MTAYKKLARNAIFTILLAVASAGVQAQGITLGAGFNGMKYLGNASSKPTALGFDLGLGIDLGKKLRISAIPAYYTTVTYKYNEVLNNNIPVQSTEKMRVFQTTALLTYALIGSNSGSNLYVGVGPSLAFYNAQIDRTNYATYNYTQNFNDLLLDARVGAEVGLLLFKLFGELEIAPPIASNIHQELYYKPNRGTMLAATVGIRFHFL